MKKNYETPYAEKVEFSYEDQVVASGSDCITIWSYSGKSSCLTTPQLVSFNN